MIRFVSYLHHFPLIFLCSFIHFLLTSLSLNTIPMETPRPSGSRSNDSTTTSFRQCKCPRSLLNVNPMSEIIFSKTSNEKQAVMTKEFRMSLPLLTWGTFYTPIYWEGDKQFTLQSYDFNNSTARATRESSWYKKFDQNIKIFRQTISTHPVLVG